MTARPIVVAVDGSPESVQAAVLGWQLARISGVPCRLLFAAATLKYYLAGEPAGYWPRVREALRETVRRDLAAVLGHSVPADVLNGLEVRMGRAERVIAEAVAEWNAGMLVIGGKHHGALARGLGLSAAHHLVRLLDVPVLIVNAAPKRVARILAAVDLSRGSVAVLRAARELAKKLDAELRVIHVMEPLRDPLAGPYTIDERLVRQQASAHIRRLAGNAPEIPSRGWVMREGDPVETIALEVAEWPADLLVVGSHGLGWIDRLLIGSTTERLLNLLPCSLHVVPVRDVALKPRAARRTPGRERRKRHADQRA